MTMPSFSPSMPRPRRESESKAVEEAANRSVARQVEAMLAFHRSGVIGRDHMDSGSVASPNRETEGMRDGTHPVADWALLNVLERALKFNGLEMLFAPSMFPDILPERTGGVPCRTIKTKRSNDTESA